MLRAIPLPDESLQFLKLRNERNPATQFLFRIRLWELDRELGTDPDDMNQVINELEIERLVTTGDWPKC